LRLSSALAIHGEFQMNSILAAFVAMCLGVGAVNAHAGTYRAPAHNFYQNNWMAGGGG
jgi:hypothetical protein